MGWIKTHFELEVGLDPAHGGHSDALCVGLDQVVAGRAAALSQRQGRGAHRIGPLVGERQGVGEWHVDVAGEDQVAAPFGQGARGLRPAPDQAGHRSAGDLHQGMVADRHPQAVLLRKPAAHFEGVPLAGLALGPVHPRLQAPRGIERHRLEPRSGDGLERGRAYVAIIVPERPAEPAEHVPIGRVVIAGRADLRAGQALQPGARRLELLATAGLGDVAGDRHQIGLAFDDVGVDGRQGLGVLAAEVDVGDVDDADRHQGSTVPPWR